MFRSVAEAVPSIYRFYHLSYSQPSILKYEIRTMILSRVGQHRGDPLGPLLFCLFIHSDLVQPAEIRASSWLYGRLHPAETATADIEHIGVRQELTGLTDQRVQI